MNSPPPGHNADVSMLSGGTEQIVGVMGGGTRRNKNRRQRKSSKKSSKMSRRRQKSSRKSGGGNADANANANEKNPFILTKPVESTEVPAAMFKYTNLKKLGVTGIPLITLPNIPVSLLNKGVNEYIKAQKGMWKYHSTNGEDIAITPSVISTEICSTIKYSSIDGQNGVSGYDRLSIILPKETQRIIVFPPCYGNLITYGKCAEYINNSTDSNTVFIFTPPFYSREQSESKENRTIFHHFISMKKQLNEDGLASAHILSEYTNATVNSACILTGETMHKETSLIPMLEPTYIIYPYMIKIDGDSVNGIIFSAAAHDEVILPESNITSKSGLIVTAQYGVSGGHVFPPNTNKNDALLKESSIPYRQYRFFSKDSEDILNTSGERVTMIKLGGSTVSELHGGGEQDEDDKKKFEPSKIVSLEGVSYTSVPLGAHQYSLRHPTRNIIDDWKNERFTEDETKFLNDLKLRPYILKTIYKNNDRVWQDELANNMATIVRSKCFNDSRLVLHSDCQASQKFIADILEYYVQHEDRISSLEEDEAEARNRELRMKYEKVKAKLEASDFNDVDITGWDKDPFADGLVRATGQKISDPNMDYNIITSIVSNEYTIVRSLINKRTEEEIIGEIVCTSEEANNKYENAKKILQDKYNIIEKEYKGWVITP